MLIKCYECGKEVSDTAKHCPHCGAKVKKVKVVKENDRQPSQPKRTVEGATDSNVEGATTITAERTTGNKAERVTGVKMVKRIFLSTLIPSCAIALCFLILTVFSFVTPYSFLRGKTCKDGYAFIDELIKESDSGREYSINIQGDWYYIMRSDYGNGKLITVMSNSLSGQVQYEFEKDGNIRAYTFYQRYEFDYEIKGTNPVFVQAFYNYEPITLTSEDRELADASIELAEAVIDYVLDYNGKDYTFNDILKEYDDYKDSLTGIKVSSIVLTSLFTVVAVADTVICVLLMKKMRKNETPVSDDANVDGQNLEEISE